MTNISKELNSTILIGTCVLLVGSIIGFLLILTTNFYNNKNTNHFDNITFLYK